MSHMFQAHVEISMNRFLTSFFKSVSPYLCLAEWVRVFEGLACMRTFVRVDRVDIHAIRQQDMAIEITHNLLITELNTSYRTWENRSISNDNLFNH